MKPAIDADSVRPADRPAAPEPFGSRLGAWEGRSLGDHFEHAQFGVNLETVQPGCESALRHWHTRSDEFVYVLEGELTSQSLALSRGSPMTAILRNIAGPLGSVAAVSYRAQS
jgi:uncharacterized cupin superfamily protein